MELIKYGNDKSGLMIFVGTFFPRPSAFDSIASTVVKAMITFYSAKIVDCERFLSEI